MLPPHDEIAPHSRLCVGSQQASLHLWHWALCGLLLRLMTLQTYGYVVLDIFYCA